MADTTEREMRWAIWLLIILVAIGAALGGAKINHPWSGAFVGLALWALVMLSVTCFVADEFFARAKAGLAILAAAGAVVLVFGLDFDFDARSLGIPDSVLTGNGGVTWSSRFDCTLYNASDFTIVQATVAVQTFDSKNPIRKSDVRRFDIPLHLKPRTTEVAGVPTGLQSDYRPDGSYSREYQVGTSWWILGFKARTNLYRYFISTASRASNQTVAVVPATSVPAIESAAQAAETQGVVKAPTLPPPPPPLPVINQAQIAIDHASPKTSQQAERTVAPHGYFTIGSSKDEVLAVQGTPTKPGLFQWEYGYSKVEFDHAGMVISWYNSTLNPLKVKMVPVGGSSRNYFTIGSSKDEVLAVQGTPTKPGLFQWEYGYSKVEFDRAGMVISWYNSTLNPLKVKMVP